MKFEIRFIENEEGMLELAPLDEQSDEYKQMVKQNEEFREFLKTREGLILWNSFLSMSDHIRELAKDDPSLLKEKFDEVVSKVLTKRDGAKKALDEIRDNEGLPIRNALKIWNEMQSNSVSDTPKLRGTTKKIAQENPEEFKEFYSANSLNATKEQFGISIDGVKNIAKFLGLPEKK